MHTTDAQQAYLILFGISLMLSDLYSAESFWRKGQEFWGGDNIGHCEEKVHMTMCLILKGYRYRTV